MMMLVYRIDADTAFELLRWRSQETNVKPPACWRAADHRRLRRSSPTRRLLPPRATFDHLLLTAHQRVDAAGPAAGPA